MSGYQIKIRDLSKEYKLYDRNFVDRFKDTFLPRRKERAKTFFALKNIDLNVKRGDILGVLGRNGAGKSTLLKVITGVTQASSGSLIVDGKIVALLELGGGFNPEYTGKENVYFSCSLMGLSKKEIDDIYDDIVRFAELEDFIDIPLKKYSSGMKARLGFATSININPDILILDEVLSVGDELFRRKCFMKMNEFFQNGKTIIYVSHSSSEIQQLCNRAIFMHKGEIILDGHPDLVIQQYHHYLSSQDQPHNEVEILDNIKALNRNEGQKAELERIVTQRDLESKVDEVTATDDSRACFVPEFITKSIDFFKKKDIQITEYSLKTLEGHDVNHLIWGETYCISFKAKFNEELHGIRLGIVIFNSYNDVVTGTYDRLRIDENDVVSSGDVISYSKNFTALLKDGLYAIQFLVNYNGSNGEDVAAAATDAIVFQCYPRKENTSGPGIVDLFIS